jgi:hypothetical protein
MKKDHTKVPDPKFMDGPIVHWTVADLFKSDKKTFMKYHVMESGYGALTPVGTILGGIVYGVGIRPFPSALQMMGTTGLVTGVAGMILGLTRMNKVASQGESASPPWTDDGIQNRVDGLSHNFKVRTLDLSVWSGMGLAAGALVLAVTCQARSEQRCRWYLATILHPLAPATRPFLTANVNGNE